MFCPPPPHWISRRPGRGVVLLHGMVMSPVFWSAYAPPVVRMGRCAAYPLPGHHPWPLGGKVPETDEIVAAYAAAIERDFRGPVDVVGHSTGGFIGLLLASSHPELVRSVVLLGGFACGRFEGRERLSMRLARVPALGRPLFEFFYQRWISGPERFRAGALACVGDPSASCETAAARQAMEAVRRNLLHTQADDIIALVNWMARTALLERLDDVRAPVLNIVGGRDAIVPPAHQLRVQSRLPTAVTVLIPKAGHLPMIEAKADVDRAIGRFLRGLPLAASRGAVAAMPRNETGAPARPGALLGA